MFPLQTQRLSISHFDCATSTLEFIVTLLNEPSFIANIGDKNIRNINDAQNYLNDGPIKSYQDNGFGLNLVSLKGSYIPIGMCGLVKRPELEIPDLGYAFLPKFTGQGLAFEASKAVLCNSKEELQIKKVAAVTFPDNLPSNTLLNRLDFKLSNQIELYGKMNNYYQYSL